METHVCICGVNFMESPEQDAVPSQPDVPTPFAAAPTSQTKRNVVHLISNFHAPGPVLSQTLRLLSGRLCDDEKEIAMQAATSLHKMALEEPSCRAIIGQPEVLAALGRVISANSDAEMVATAVSTMHHVSHHRSGQPAIFESGAIPALCVHLSSPSDSVAFDALITVHNLICQQAGGQAAFRLADGVVKLVHLLERSHTQLVILAAHCLNVLANGNAQNQRIIIAEGGLSHLHRILNANEEDELVDFAMDVLMTLALDTGFAKEIVRAGGLQTLTTFVLASVEQLDFMRKCMWLIHRLSFVDWFAVRFAMSRAELKRLMDILMVTLDAHDVDITLADFSVRALHNLTGHGPRYRQLLCQMNAVDAFVQTIRKASVVGTKIAETAARVLAHLTADHDLAHAARDAVRAAPDAMRDIVQVLIASKRWPSIKALIKLVRNLAIDADNRDPLRQVAAVDYLVELVKKAERDYRQSMADSTSLFYAVGVSIEDIIVDGLEALYVLADNETTKELVRTLDAIPTLIQCLSSDNEDIRKVAVAVLHTIATNAANADLMVANGVMPSLDNFLAKSELNDFEHFLATQLRSSLLRRSNALPSQRTPSQ